MEEIKNEEVPVTPEKKRKLKAANLTVDEAAYFDNKNFTKWVRDKLKEEISNTQNYKNISE